MKAPERIWVCPDLIVPQDKELRVIEGAEKIPDWTCGTFWEGDPPDYPHGQMYHHDDTVTALQAEVDRLREALGKCVNELEATARSEYEGVWHEQDFVDMCSPYRAALDT